MPSTSVKSKPKAKAKVKVQAKKAIGNLPKTKATVAVSKSTTTEMKRRKVEEQVEFEEVEDDDVEDEDEEEDSDEVAEAERYTVRYNVKSGVDKETVGYGLSVHFPTSLDLLVTKLKSLEQEHKNKKLLSLSFDFEYDDHTEEMDFNGKKKNLNDYLQGLETLSFQCCPFDCFLNVELPKCRSLSFDHSARCGEGGPDFNAPSLEDIDFQFCTYDNHSSVVDKSITKSLNNSPLLQSIHSYKLWGPSNLGPLYLPNAVSVGFYRSDCLSSLRLYAPRLEELDLRAAYGIRNITLLKRGKAEHKEWNVTKEENHSKISLNLINVGLAKDKRVEIANWPRLRNVQWGDGGDGFDICSVNSEADAESTSEEEDEGPQDSEGETGMGMGGRIRPPTELVTVGGISEGQKKDRARWVREADQEGDGCTIM